MKIVTNLLQRGMRSVISLFMLCCLLTACKSIKSQPDLAIEEGIFAYANNINGSHASIILEDQHYKFEVAHKVLMDLVHAKGDLRMPVPTLKITDAERRVAYAKPNQAIIGLESKAYDICSSFGKDSLNALAVLLAHELTHYYEKHDWTSHFVSEHKNMEVSDQIKLLNEKMKLETQADYLGGFLAYTAGYPTLEIMPDFLKKIYKGYDFPDKMKGYPELSERQQIATRALEKLKSLVKVFETANWLAAIEKHETALEYYNHILLDGQFQSREVYNNMGVMAIQAAISYHSDTQLKYIYPVELDPISRIGKNRRGESKTEKIQKLLDQSIIHFNTALNLDKDYAPALLNIACAYALKKEYEDAQYYAKKSLRVASDSNQAGTVSDAECLLGVIAAMQDQEEKAHQHFDKSIELNNTLAKANKDALNGTKIKGNPLNMDEPKPELIDDVDIKRIIRKDLGGNLEIEEDLKINKKTLFEFKQYPQSVLLKHSKPFNNKAIYFLHTLDGYSGQTKRGISIGSTVAELTAAYGQPKTWQALTTGEYLIYNTTLKGLSLIFVVDRGKVTGWCISKEEHEGN